MGKKKSGAVKKTTDQSDPPSPTTHDTVDKTTRLHIWQIQAVRDVLLVAAIVGIFWMGYVLRAVTVPLLVALMLAYLFEPIIERLGRNPKMTRVRTVSALLGTVGLSVAIVLAIIIPLIVSQSMQFKTYWKDGSLRHQATGLVEHYVPQSFRIDILSLVEKLPEGDSVQSSPSEPATEDTTDDSPTEGSLDGQGEAVAAELTQDELDALIDEKVDEKVKQALAAQSESQDKEGLFDSILPGADDIFIVLSWIVQAGLIAFLIPFYFFFFSLWYPSVVSFGHSLIPEKNKGRTMELLEKMDYVVSGFVRGRIIISLIMGLLLSIGWLIFGVPFAIVVGMVTGIFCAVPYLGVIGLPVAVILLLFDQFDATHSSEWWWAWAILWPTLVFVIVQMIEGYVLTPMIAGKVTGLDPVTILVAVLAGGSVLGMYGMLLAIPLAACGKILLTEVLLPRVKDWTEGKVSDPLPITRD